MLVTIKEIINQDLEPLILRIIQGYQAQQRENPQGKNGRTTISMSDLITLTGAPEDEIQETMEDLQDRQIINFREDQGTHRGESGKSRGQHRFRILRIF